MNAFDSALKGVHFNLCRFSIRISIGNLLKISIFMIFPVVKNIQSCVVLVNLRRLKFGFAGPSFHVQIADVIVGFHLFVGR